MGFWAKLLEGTQGRKYQLFFVATGTGFTGYILTIAHPALSANLVSLLTFITGMYAIYCGGNVASSWGIGPTPPSDDKKIKKEPDKTKSDADR